MRFLAGCLVVGLLLTTGTTARAGEPDGKFVRWYERIEKELEDLEQRIAAMDGTSADNARTKRVEKRLTKLLMALTGRVMELEKRLNTLEKGADTAAATKKKDAKQPVTEAEPAEAKVAAKGDEPDGAAKAKAKKKKAALTFLKDPKILKQIPQPPKDSKVKFTRMKSGGKRGGLRMPGGTARGPWGDTPCTPSGEVFLLGGAPVIGLELVLVNKLTFRFKDEKFVYIRIGGNTTKSAVHWHGTTITTEEGILYVETLHFATGLPDLLAMLRAGRVSILIGACEFVFDRVYLVSLRDLCSVFHPDRVDALL